MSIGMSTRNPSTLKQDVTETSLSMHAVDKQQNVESAKPNAVASLEVLTEQDVQHMINEEKRVILLLQGEVYDLTDFVMGHPGGEMAIMSRVGKESGDVFDRIHSRSAKIMVKKYMVGRLKSVDAKLNNFTQQMALTPSTFKEGVVLDTEVMCEGVKKITLSSPERLHLLPGTFIKLVVFDELGRELPKRGFYTPYAFAEASFTIAVKKYPNGICSGYLHSRKCGERICYEDFIPPSWSAENDEWLQKEAPDKRHVLCIAGGVGITSMYAMMQHMLQNQIAFVTFVGCYQDLNHVVLRREVAMLMEKYGEGRCERDKAGEKMPCKTLRLHYVFTRLKELVSVPETSTVHLGLFGPEVVRHLRSATSVIMCGPPTLSRDVRAALVEGGICDNERVTEL